MKTLKIELAGDFQKGKTHPIIRLKGQWLAALGFPPGARVHLQPGPPGTLTLSAIPATPVG